MSIVSYGNKLYCLLEMKKNSDTELGFVHTKSTELREETRYEMFTGDVTKMIEISAGGRAIECAARLLMAKCSGFKINDETLCDIYEPV